MTGRAAEQVKTAEQVKKEDSVLTLTAGEMGALRLALKTYVTDLGMEIRHTDSYDFREELKRQRTVLDGVLCRLTGAPVDGQREA